MQLQRVIGCSYKPEFSHCVCFATTKSHAKASPAFTESSTQQRQLPIQQHAFKTLRTNTPVCLTDIAQPHPGYNGLIAASDVQRGQIVLQLPACNSLCVPISDSVYRWECDWLHPYEAVHGPLPGALSYYLADQDVPPILRLATLILYLKHTNSTTATPSSINSSTSSRDFWSSWLDLLPRLSAATYPGADWTDSDIQQLHFEPAMAVFASEAEAYKSMIGQLVQDLNSTSRGLNTLGLAPDSEEASWALFIAKTRSGSDNASMWLHPIHDFINHADTPNCQAAPSSRGYLVKAVMDIPAGCELTISYAPPEGLCNLELLIAWGFTTSTKPLDWALPQTYHLLPPIDYNLTLAAAVRLALRQQQQQQQQLVHMGHAAAGDPHSAATPEALSWEWFDRLGVAAASLPLALSSSDSSSSSAAALYADAARVLQAHGGDLLQQQRGQNSQQRRWEDSDLLQAYIDPDPNQAFTSHQTLLCTLEIEFIRASKAVTESTGCSRQRDHLFQENAECLSQSLQCVSAGSLEVQHLSAAAVHNACQLLLLQSGSTIQQDEELLKLLHQQQQQQSSNILPATSGTDIQSHNGGSSSSSASSSSGKTDKQVDSRFTQLLERFGQLQQQLCRNLVLLQAYCIADSISATRSSSRPVHRMAAAQNTLAAAARRVISTILHDHTRGHQVSAQSTEVLLHQAAEILLQQEDLLRLLQELQQQKQQQPQPALILGIAAGKVGGRGDLKPERASLEDSSAIRARMLTAIQARLGHKRLLELCAQLANEVRLLVATLLQSRNL